MVALICRAPVRVGLMLSAIAAGLATAAPLSGSAQESPALGSGDGGGNPTRSDALSPDRLIDVPVVNLTPGAVNVRPKLAIPKLDADAAQRGLQYFTNFNCVGCHMPNGGGGMGPALSHRPFIYGDRPENIYLSIHQGRPNGMPAWGTVIPEKLIWDLVAYVENISQAPVQQWGTTTSMTSPAIEQVPKEFKPSTARPWNYTQKFSNGQAPNP